MMNTPMNPFDGVGGGVGKKSSNGLTGGLRTLCCGSRIGYMYRHTGVLLDICAMLKSLFAAVSILRLLQPSQMMTCRDYYGDVGSFDVILAPAWYVLQICQPTLDINSIMNIFFMAIIFNQLTFATTSILNHTKLGGLLSRSQRTIAAYTLAMCSFIFGFCKILLIIAIPLTHFTEFPCQPSDQFTSSLCSDKAALISGGVTGQPSPWYEMQSCSEYCGYSIPMEVFILAVTFVLTFIYSLFMCQQLLNRPDSNASLVEVQQQQLQELVDPMNDTIVGNDNDAPDDEPKDEVELHSGYGALIGSRPFTEPLISASTTSSEIALTETHSPKSASSSTSSGLTNRGTTSGNIINTDASSHDSSIYHAHPMASAPPRIPRKVAASQHDLIELDPLSSRAMDLAQGLTAQQLLLCMIESDYRKHLTKELRQRDLFYRMLRDVATLAKFVLTMVSLSFIIYGPSIIECDNNQGYYATLGVTPSIIRTSCLPSLSSQSPSFMFTVLGVCCALIFTFIIIMEKLILAPSQSTWLSVICLTSVVILLCSQFMLIFHIGDLPLNFPCVNYVAPPINSTGLGKLSQSNVCRTANVTITSQTSSIGPSVWVECDQACYVNLGASTYILFASLILALVYMASLVFRYQKLARIFVATQRTLSTEMENLLAATDDGNPLGNGKVVPRDVVLAIMAKS